MSDVLAAESLHMHSPAAPWGAPSTNGAAGLPTSSAASRHQFSHSPSLQSWPGLCAAPQSPECSRAEALPMSFAHQHHNCAGLSLSLTPSIVEQHTSSYILAARAGRCLQHDVCTREFLRLCNGAEGREAPRMALAFATCSAIPASSSASSSTGLVISCKHMVLQTPAADQAHQETS